MYKQWSVDLNADAELMWKQSESSLQPNGEKTSPISVILVSSGSRGNKLLFRYPFQRASENTSAAACKCSSSSVCNSGLCTGDCSWYYVCIFEYQPDKVTLSSWHIAKRLLIWLHCQSYYFTMCTKYHTFQGVCFLSSKQNSGVRMRWILRLTLLRTRMVIQGIMHKQELKVDFNFCMFL